MLFSFIVVVPSDCMTFLVLLSLFQISMNAQRVKTTVISFVVTPTAPLSAHVILDSHWPVMERLAMVLHLH